MTCALNTELEDDPSSSWLREAPHNLDSSGLKLLFDGVKQRRSSFFNRRKLSLREVGLGNALMLSL